MFCRKCGKLIDDGSTFCRFCGTEVAKIKKETRIECEYRQNNELYTKAKDLMSNNNFDEARQILLDISGFRNADDLAEKCLTGAAEYRRNSTYKHALGVFNNTSSTHEELLQAAEDFEALGDYKDSAAFTVKCKNKVHNVFENKYRNASEMLNRTRSVEEMASACESLESLGSYKDSAELARNGRKELLKYKEYLDAIKCLNQSQYVQQFIKLIETFRSFGDYLDSKAMYNRACEKVYEIASDSAAGNSDDEPNYVYAASAFEAIKFYKDAEQRAQECRERQKALIAEKEEQKRLEAEEAAESELQSCLKILNDPKAKKEELEEAHDRLLLIQEHKDAEAAIQECDKRLKIKEKRNNVIEISVIIVVIVIIIFEPLLCAFIEEILS